MPTYTQITYHLVFTTKHRSKVLTPDRRKDLYNYIWGILKNKRCFLHRIGGVEDHIHILTGLHPSLALAELVNTIKIASGSWIREKNVFPDFSHWQDSYSAFTCSTADRPRLIQYITKQEEHHRVVSYHEELRALLVEHGVKFEERYFR